MDPRFILVVNARSGSFDQDTVDTILSAAEERGLGPVELISIPDDPCPCGQDLPDDGVLAIYAGESSTGLSEAKRALVPRRSSRRPTAMPSPG